MIQTGDWISELKIYLYKENFEFKGPGGQSKMFPVPNPTRKLVAFRLFSEIKTRKTSLSSKWHSSTVFANI